MKNILSIILTPTFGGPHNQMLQMYKPLKARGYKYIVVTPNRNMSGTKRLLDQGIDVINIDLKRPRKSLNLLVHIQYMMCFWSNVQSIRLIIRNNNIHIVQLCGLFNLQGAIAAKLENRPIIWQLLSNFAPKWLRDAMSPFIRLMSDVIMTTGNQIAEEHAGVEHFKNLIPFYPPVHTEDFSNDLAVRHKVRKALNIPEDTICIGTVGNRNRQKAHHILVDIAISIRPKGKFAVLIVGNPTKSQESYYNKEVLEQINNNNLKDNHFLQIVSPSLSIAEYLQAFDIFILTSGAEGVPTAILEAMASSLPIISSRVGGVSEIVVPKKNGFLFDPQDIQMAVKHILLLGADINMQEKFGVQNRIDAKLKYDTLVCTETHIKAFSLALSNKTT